MHVGEYFKCLIMKMGIGAGDKVFSNSDICVGKYILYDHAVCKYTDVSVDSDAFNGLVGLYVLNIFFLDFFCLCRRNCVKGLNVFISVFIQKIREDGVDSFIKPYALCPSVSI